MLSLKQFRRLAYPLFEVMAKTGHTFEIVYHGTVYDLNVRRTAKKPKLTRTRISNKKEVVHAIDVANCPDCGELMFSGVCMNQACAQ